MPADRQRGSKAKRTSKAAVKKEVIPGQLTWTTPMEADAVVSSPYSVGDSDIPELKLISETPSLVFPPTEPTLFPPIMQYDPEAPTTKAAHAKKKAEDHIPRPPNAFILFRSSFIKSNHVSSQVEGDHSTLSKIIGLTWQNMPEDERKFWHGKAKAAQEEHKRKFPDYAFRPLNPRGQAPAPKRKVREIAPKDIGRCARIAELLVEGKKGSELEQAMAEFDKTNVKPVVARFEEPLTARQFRKRSCSQPPELESASSARAATFMERPSSSSDRRQRASSSQPPSRASKRRSKTTPSTPVISTPPPSTPSAEPMIDIAEESSYSEMPPLILPPIVNPDMTFSPLDPSSGEMHSFPFNTFIFNEGQAAHIDSCDPLAPIPRPSSGSSIASHSQMSVTTPHPELSIDTSFYDCWSTQSSSPAPCTPASYTAEQPPPFAALSPVAAAPDYSFAGYQQIPTVYDAQVYAPAPPYVETATYPMPMGEYEYPKDAYPYFAHKLPSDDAHHPQLFLASTELYPYTM